MNIRVFQAIVCLVIIFLTVPLKAQEIAITLDDLPYVMPSKTSPDQGLTIVRNVNAAAYTKHNIIATGFVYGKQLNQKTKPALQAFADAGHTVGNHSWSHADYGTISIGQFRMETKKTHRAILEWVDGPRYYRFPFLREGKTQKAKEMASKVLASLGYMNVPVTIDNDEWRFNASYVDALSRKDRSLAQKIANQYLAHMQERTTHFRNLARRAFGRDVKHILLLHMNLINSHYLSELLDWCAAEGWTFITVDKAISDPLFYAPDIYAGPKGLSQIERVLGIKNAKVKP